MSPSSTGHWLMCEDEEEREGEGGGREVDENTECMGMAASLLHRPAALAYHQRYGASAVLLIIVIALISQPAAAVTAGTLTLIVIIAVTLIAVVTAITDIFTVATSPYHLYCLHIKCQTLYTIAMAIVFCHTSPMLFLITMATAAVPASH
ncbi:uncharacterized protein V6R79_016135 [Siganus canaliculatus]